MNDENSERCLTFDLEFAVCHVSVCSTEILSSVAHLDLLEDQLPLPALCKELDPGLTVECHTQNKTLALPSNPPPLSSPAIVDQ
jgi:hypothetical protein